MFAPREEGGGGQNDVMISPPSPPPQCYKVCNCCIPVGFHCYVSASSLQLCDYDCGNEMYNNTLPLLHMCGSCGVMITRVGGVEETGKGSSGLP